MDAKEEVRARLNIEDVVGEYVQLKRAGRSYKGLSPFTSERTPSFFVSPRRIFGMILVAGGAAMSLALLWK